VSVIRFFNKYTSFVELDVSLPDRAGAVLAGGQQES
jgi:hypothetical protein